LEEEAFDVTPVTCCPRAQNALKVALFFLIV
jgi:hypothetical protein